MFQARELSIARILQRSIERLAELGTVGQRFDRRRDSGPREVDGGKRESAFGHTEHKFRGASNVHDVGV